MTAPTPSTGPMDLRSRVLDAVRREPSAPRPVAARRRTWLLMAGFGAAAIVAAITQFVEWLQRTSPEMAGGQPAWSVVADSSSNPRPVGYVVTLEVAWLLVAIVATWGGLTRGRSMLGRPALGKMAVATLTPLALVLMWLLVAMMWLETVLPRAWLEAMGDAEDARFHANCALLSVACAVGPLAAFFILRYRKDPVGPTQTGAALGAVAGAWAAVLHFPSCQCTSPLHIALGHVLPVVVLAAIGALLGQRVLGVRAAPSET